LFTAQRSSGVVQPSPIVNSASPAAMPPPTGEGAENAKDFFA
jgi:hypothetical protein